MRGVCMHVTSTEIKNNLGKYLKICKNEQVLITKNGKKYALLLSYPDNESTSSIGESKLVYGTNPKQNQFITYKEFLEITENSEQRFELIDGRIYLLGSPGYTHQDILGNLYIVFWQYFKEHEACKPFLSPFDIELFR